MLSICFSIHVFATLWSYNTYRRTNGRADMHNLVSVF